MPAHTLCYAQILTRFGPKLSHQVRTNVNVQVEGSRENLLTSKANLSEVN